MHPMTFILRIYSSYYRAYIFAHTVKGPATYCGRDTGLLCAI